MSSPAPLPDADCAPVARRLRWFDPISISLGLCLASLALGQLGCAEGQRVLSFGDEGAAAGGGAGGSGGQGGGAGSGDQGGDVAGEGGGGGAGGAGREGGEGGEGGTGGTGGSPPGPTGVTLSGLTDTAQHGNLGGGAAFNDACPPGQVVIGYSGLLSSDDDTHQRIQALCGVLGVTALAPYEVVVSPGATLPMRGEGGDFAWTRTCAADRIVVGFTGRSGALLDQLGLRCAELLIVGAPGAYTLSLSDITDLPLVGGSGGSAFSTTDCPPGDVTTVSNIRAGSSLDAFGIGCSTPALTY